MKQLAFLIISSTTQSLRNSAQIQAAFFSAQISLLSTFSV